MKKLFFTFLMAGLIQAHAINIGLFTDGSYGQAVNNINKYTSDFGHTWGALNAATFNATDVATLASTYDVIIAPWYAQSANNLEWATRVLPFLQAGGSVMWEDPQNIGDLAGSGISLTSSTYYPGASGEGSISLVDPFDDNGAVGYYHIHYGITGINSDWDIWAQDTAGGIHGVYGEFGSNGGRMVLGVSDNLYHPNFNYAGEADHYNLFINQMNWLDTGDVDVPAGTEVPDGSTPLLLLGSVFGLMAVVRGRKS